MGKFRAAIAAAALAAAAGLAAPAAADPPAGKAAATAADERATNQALLDALLRRRGEVVAAPGSEADKRAALDFLDKRIAEIKARLEK